MASGIPSPAERFKNPGTPDTGSGEFQMSWGPIILWMSPSPGP
eukprot:CAMPEP_0203914988 /NCGR_PEP_ID=MMETSP0359-20131031/55831_1 /ASSEMBLY_ACC=CAM_ASM_000338 /TAXON_ID=268821 /ORGANISM="Scrippsiella Hangoei, Strain SHTV-5" /LENGTH=42 /DNA_ID= /DNA_START= /DNA_END= /DNA_ORIENTATION=